MKKNKKDILAAILGIVVTAAVVLAVVAVIILIDAGIVVPAGCAQRFLWTSGGLRVAGVSGRVAARAVHQWFGRRPVSVGLGQPQNGKSLYIPLDTLCSALAFWGTDLLLDQVEANGFAILIVALVSAVFSSPSRR